MKEIVVVGGGAAGLFASIVIKEQLGKDAKVTILERLERVGKKVLATGAGKANFTNAKVNAKKYNQPTFVNKALKKFGYKETIAYFEKLGLFSTVLSEDRVYPKSEAAQSLLDVLRNKVKDYGIEEKCNSEVKKITPEKGGEGYIIELARNNKMHADYVILATGGKASPILGSNGTGYNLCKALKIKVTDTYPGLAGIKVDANEVKGLDGLRVKANVGLLARKHKEAVWEEAGEVQFKSDSVSGIVIMNMSTQIARAEISGEYVPTEFVLDLLPELSSDELKAKLLERKEALLKYSNANFLIGIFHKMLGQNLLKRAKIDVAGYVESLTVKEIDRLVKVIKEFTLTYKALDSFDHAQVTVGGVDIAEVVPETLEARSAAGVYICGELLDVDGECGGFNLQWAWTSAYIAAMGVVERIKSL